jgi:DNA-binding transcriptional LysR family regulator
VSLRIFGSPEVERAVLEGRCDLGVLVSEPVTDGFTVDAVGTDELVVVVSRRHRLAGRGEVAAEELARERFLIREPSSGTRRFIEACFGQIGVQLQYGLELNNNEAIKALVASNLGVSILSRQTVHFELMAGNLAALRVKGLRLVRTLNLIACAGAQLGPAARAVRAVMLAGSVIDDQS